MSKSRRRPRHRRSHRATRVAAPVVVGGAAAAAAFGASARHSAQPPRPPPRHRPTPARHPHRATSSSLPPLPTLPLPTTLPTTPTSYIGDNTGAEIWIAPSGKFVYASNRGHDSIAIFAVDAKSGTIEPVGWESVQGRKPTKG